MKYFTFSFDDGYKSWMTAAEILEEYGWRGTFNVCLRNVVHKRVTTRPRMFPDKDVITWEEVLQLQARGHEIASHGVRHVDLPLCNKAEKYMEIVGSKLIFKSRGVNVETYTCAFNAYNQECIKLSEPHYKSFRTNIGVNKHPPKSPIYHADRPSAVDDICKSETDNLWLIGIWHDVPLAGFRKRCEQLKEANIKVITVRKAYA